MSKSQLRNILLKYAPVFSFIVYGSWAAWVNYQTQSQKFISAGMIQGTYAFISTLLLEVSALKIFSILKFKYYAKLMTYIICMILMIGLPILLHFINHTEKIFYSILPGAVIGSVYLYLLLRYNTQTNNNRSQHVNNSKIS